ncbi:MAG: hypothetical protein Q4A09_03550 [Capnocytophaga felis]|nr:hypothetical protein [Capnocytophaga felis]
MKPNFIVLLFFIFQAAFSQQYILLDELEKDFEIQKYTLNTQKMYRFDGEIHIYNIEAFGRLVLISEFPDLEQKSSVKTISEEELQSKKESLQSIISQIDTTAEKKAFNKFYLVKRIGNQYYAANYCLFEIFVLFDEEKLHLSGRNIINTKQKMVSYQDVKKNYGDSFPMENTWWGERYSTISNLLKYIYLSEITYKNNENIYRFWTFDDWHIRKGYNYHRGIDRFAYIKGKGIVGGSYDFYFDRIDSDSAIKRTVRYDIMWARELFPERQ